MTELAVASYFLRRLSPSLTEVKVNFRVRFGLLSILLEVDATNFSSFFVSEGSASVKLRQCSRLLFNFTKCIRTKKKRKRKRNTALHDDEETTKLHTRAEHDPRQALTSLADEYPNLDVLSSSPGVRYCTAALVKVLSF